MTSHAHCGAYVCCIYVGILHSPHSQIIMARTTHVLTGLEPNTTYEVSVCRAIGNNTRSDNCGGCTLCVDTVEAEGIYINMCPIILYNGPSNPHKSNTSCYI